MLFNDEITDAEMKQFLDENEYLKNLIENEKQLEIDSNLLNSSAEHHWLLKDYYLNSPTLPSRNLNIIILILDPFKSNIDLQKSLDLLLNKINENLDSFYKYYPWITDPPCFKIHDHEGTIYINGFLRIHNSVHNSPFTNEIWMMVSLLNNIFKDEKELYPDIYYKITKGSQDFISSEMTPIYMRLPYFRNVMEPIYINRCWIRQGSIWFIPLDKDQRKIYDLIDSLNFIKNYPFKLYYDLELNESFHKILDIFPEKTINSTIYLKYKLPNNNNLLKFIINNSYNRFSFLNKQINNYITYQILNKNSITKDLLIKNFENLSKLIDNENTDISIDNNKNLIELDLITNFPTFLQITKFLTNSNDLINQESPDYTNITETDKFKIDLGNLILKSIDFNISNSKNLDIKKQKLEMSVEDYNNHISSFPLNKKQGFKERYNLEKAIDEYDLSMIFSGYEPVIPEKEFEMTEQDAGNLAEKLTQQLNELNINNKDISNINKNKETVNKKKNEKSNYFSSAFAKKLASGFGGLDFGESNSTKKKGKDDDEKSQEEEKKRKEQTKRHMDELDALNEKYIDNLHTSNGYYDSDGSYSSDGEEERIRNTIAEDEFFEFFCSEALHLSPEQIETFLATRERNI